VDIRGKWVCFDDPIALEVFLVICEEQGYNRGAVSDVRGHLEEHYNKYRHAIKEGRKIFFYGYHVDSDGDVFAVKSIKDIIYCSSAEFDGCNKFTSEDM